MVVSQAHSPRRPGHRYAAVAGGLWREGAGCGWGLGEGNRVGLGTLWRMYEVGVGGGGELVTGVVWCSLSISVVVTQCMYMMQCQNVLFRQGQNKV